MKQWRRLTSLTVVTLALATGCGPASESTTTVDAGACATTFSQVTLWPTCVRCHSSKLTGTARMSAPNEVNFDTYAAAQPQAALAWSWVSNDLMPPEPPPATAAEKTSLKAWVDCEAAK